MVSTSRIDNKQENEKRMSVAAAVARELKVEFDREDDGRWIADIPQLPGVLVYGETREDAFAKAQALALRVLADAIEEHHQPERGNIRFVAA